MRRHLLLQPRLDTLSHHQRRVLAELGATPDDFVLYDGAALALRLAHRRPDEFSFLSAQPFDPLRLIDSVPYLHDAEVIRRGTDTLTCIVDRGGIVRVSFSGGVVHKRVDDPERAEPPGIGVALSLPFLGTPRLICRSGFRGRPGCWAPVEASVASRSGCPTGRWSGRGVAWP